MCKITKFFLAILIFIVISYTSFWFYSANKIEQAIAQISIDSHDKLIKYSYKHLDVSGFPFKFKLRFSDVNLQYPNVLDYKVGLIKATTNITFNKLNISAFGKVTSEAVIHGNNFITDTIYNDPFEVNLLAEKRFNTAKILKSIYKNELPQDIKLKELNITQKDAEVFYHNSDEKISKGSINLLVSFERPDEKITNIIAKTQASSEIFDVTKIASEPVYFPFKKLELSNEIFIKHKREGDDVALPYINIKDFSIALDEYKINASALSDTSTEDFKLEANISLFEWEKFLNLLIKDQQLSEEKKQLFVAIFKDITEEDNLSNPIKFDIKRQGNQMLVGKKSVSDLMIKYSKDFMLGE